MKKKKNRSRPNKVDKEAYRVKVCYVLGMHPSTPMSTAANLISTILNKEIPEKESFYSFIRSNIGKVDIKKAQDDGYITIKRSKSEKADADFYKSKAWLDLRYMALRNSDGRCECCGATAQDGVKIHVDHIKPRSKFPELALKLNNLQVLCDDCNYGKSNYYNDDWRNKF